MTRGQRIKKLRLLNDLSPKELGAKIERNEDTILKYECDGINDIPSSVITNLATVLNTTTDYLNGLIDDPRPIKEIVEEVMNTPIQFAASTKGALDISKMSEKDAETITLLYKHIMKEYSENED